MTIQYSALLTRFEAMDVNAAEFGHREHVQVAFEMLHKYSYIDACTKYANAIITIATNAGASDKFNVTITFAFLSLIAERMHGTSWSSFEEFLSRNGDLLSSDALERWYSREELEIPSGKIEPVEVKAERPKSLGPLSAISSAATVLISSSLAVASPLGSRRSMRSAID